MLERVNWRRTRSKYEHCPTWVNIGLVKNGTNSNTQQKCRLKWLSTKNKHLAPWNTSTLTCYRNCCINSHQSLQIDKDHQTLCGWFKCAQQTQYGGQLPHWMKKLEAIQRWSAICHMWPWSLTYQKFLLCISNQGQDLYSHQKLNMYIYWFSSESGYRPRQRRQRQRRTPQYNH